MKRYEYVVVIVLAIIFLILVTLAIGIIVGLVEENEFLTEDNHMLKNALDDLGAQIEELSNRVDALNEEWNRVEEWNKDARH